MKTILWILLLAIAQSAFADIPLPVKQSLQAAGIPEQSVSIFVQPVNKSSFSLTHQPDMAMNPASVMKLLTTYASLDLLGAAYKWKTEALINGDIRDGVLRGNLYIKGYGDPALTIDQLWLFIKRLHTAGIKTVDGDVVFDNSYFVYSEINQADFDNKPERAYNVAPNALLINFGAVDIKLFANAKDDQAMITTEPQMDKLKVVNQLKLDAEQCGNWRDRLSVQIMNDKIKTLTFIGKYSILCGEKNYPLALFNQDEYVRELFLQLWQETGGKIKGTTKMGSIPLDASLYVKFDSSSLADVIRDMNKWSNNVMTRQLYLTLGAEGFGSPATLEKSHNAMNQWLNKKGWSFPELVIENGAGLSRTERITVQHMGVLLKDAWAHPLMPEFVSSFPIAGIDGTMRSRFKETQVINRAHLKTGTLNDVKTMAGYVLNQSNEPIVVVFFINHPNAQKGKQAEDELIKWASQITTH